MAEDETYQGVKNRETWAFNLHWENDQGLYNMIQDYARTVLRGDEEMTDAELGGRIIEYVKEMWREFPTGGIAMWRDEVGSVWRVDEESVGESVREAL